MEGIKLKDLLKILGSGILSKRYYFNINLQACLMGYEVDNMAEIVYKGKVEDMPNEIIDKYNDWYCMDLDIYTIIDGTAILDILIVRYP